MLYTIRLLSLTLSLAVSSRANDLNVFNTTILQPPSSSSVNSSASLQIPGESLCSSPQVRPISTLAPNSYHCFITGASKLLYVEADFLSYQRPPQYSAQDRSDLLSLLDAVYNFLNSRAGSTGNAFLPAPTPPDQFSELSFIQGGMNVATATFPCTGTIGPFQSFTKIAQARYGDIAVLIARLKALVQNKVSKEKNVAIIRIFGSSRRSRQPFALQHSSMLGVMAWRSTQIAELLPEEMQSYRSFTCAEAGDQPGGESVAVD